MARDFLTRGTSGSFGFADGRQRKPSTRELVLLLGCFAFAGISVVSLRDAHRLLNLAQEAQMSAERAAAQAKSEERRRAERAKDPQFGERRKELRALSQNLTRSWLAPFDALEHVAADAAGKVLIQEILLEPRAEGIQASVQATAADSESLIASLRSWREHAPAASVEIAYQREDGSKSPRAVQFQVGVKWPNPALAVAR